MLFALGIAAMSLASSQITISATQHPTIYVASSASAPEKLAARELAHWLREITGVEIPVSAAFTNRPTILVGQSEFARAAFSEISFDKLGNEEFVLKSKGNQLLVAGGRPRGTVYAVNRLLHREGVRWWTPWATTVPKKKALTLKDLNVREKPFFEARDPFWYHAFDRDWARRNGSNSAHSRLTAEDGGKVTYKGFVHTFYSLVPPEKHFKDHPEWFSLIDGKRKWEGAQLCTTNPQLRDFVVQQVRQWLKETPDASIVSVSQNDWYGACQCPDCKAIDDREGTAAGSVLTLANYVAEKIEKDYPNVAIDTLAYQYTRKATKTLKPRPNVIVRLCSIECNFAQPLTHPSNASFAQDIRDWSKLTKRLYVWNYVTDFPNYMLPFPNWYVVGPNERFFAENGVKGLFEQGAYQSYGSEMAEMEAWVQAQLLWNPKENDRALIREFLRGYYGPAAKPIGTYMDLMANAAKDANMVIWVGPDAPFFTVDTMLKAERLWQDAEAAVADSPDLLWRVKLGHLPVRYVFLSRWTPFRREALQSKLKWTLNESRKAVADEWMSIATNPGPAGWQPITMMNEGGLTPQRWVERFATDPPAVTVRATSTALPSDLAIRPGVQVVSLQDDLAVLYGEGNMVEMRSDAAASDRVACRMPSSHHEWAFQLPISKSPEKTGKWTVYVVARVEPGSGQGNAFTAGVYSADLKKGLGGIEVPTKDVGGSYKTFKVGTVELTAGCYVWVAPTQSESVKAVWIDRVLLVKE